jgi:photosystem II stability/assembly factor-like uncharacterized protein
MRALRLLWVLALAGAVHAQPSVTWEPTGGPARYLRDLYVGEAGVIVGVAREGVLRSTDGGQTWSAVLVPALIHGLVAHPSGAIFVAGWPGIFRSLDDGATWERVHIPIITWDMGNCPGSASFTEHLALSVGSDGGLVAIGNYDYGGVYCQPAGFVQRSTDGGQTWSFTPLLSAFGAYPVLALDAARHLTGLVDGVLRCGEGFYCGYQAATDLGAAAAVFARAETPEGSHVYVGTSGQTLDEWKADTLGSARHGNGAFRSADGGATWERVADGLLNTTVTALVALPDGRVLGGTYAGGVHVTTAPGGLAWAAVNDGLPESPARSILTLALGPGGRAYAATKAGLFRTTGPLVAGEAGPDTPGALALRTPRPNPARGTTTVGYTLRAPSTVRLDVLDVTGRGVAVLAEGPRRAGAHEAALDASGLAPGVYVVRLSAGGAVRTRRLVVAR